MDIHRQNSRSDGPIDGLKGTIGLSTEEWTYPIQEKLEIILELLKLEQNYRYVWTDLGKQFFNCFANQFSIGLST